MSVDASLGLMTPHHSRWREFYNLLEGPEGCDFHPKNPDDPESVTWKCDSQDTSKPLSRKILKAMGATEKEVEQSIGYFTGNGGACDCEVLFNIESSAGIPRPKRKRKTGRISG